MALDNIDNIVSVMTVLASVGAAAGAVYSSWRWLLGPIYKALKSLAKMAESMPHIEKELKNIKEELKPNGGKSLRDVINRIEKNLLIEKHARRAMSMAMDIGVFETDEDGLCVWINQCYMEISGLNISGAKGFGWVNGIAEYDRDRVVDEWKDSVNQQRAFHMQYDMVNIKSNQVTRVKCDSFPICNESNKVVGHVGIITVQPNDS